MLLLEGPYEGHSIYYEAKSPAGFELTTIRFKGMYYTTALQLLPNKEIFKVKNLLRIHQKFIRVKLMFADEISDAMFCENKIKSSAFSQKNSVRCHDFSTFDICFTDSCLFINVL